MYMKTRLTLIRLLLSLALCVLPALTLQAQNRIDRLVETYSSVGNCKFTSAVERDPKTNAVVKVVKVLEQNELVNPQPLIDAFRAERRTGEYSEQREGGKRTFTLVTTSARQSRIYMLQVVGVEYSGKSYASSVRTTVIAKFK